LSLFENAVGFDYFFCPPGPVGVPVYGDVPPSYYDNEDFTNSGFEDKTIRQAFIRKVTEK